MATRTVPRSPGKAQAARKTDSVRIVDSAARLRGMGVLLSHIIRGVLHAPDEMDLTFKDLEPIYVHFVVPLECALRDHAELVRTFHTTTTPETGGAR